MIFVPVRVFSLRRSTVETFVILSQTKIIGRTGLWSRSARVPHVTNFYLWTTEKTYSCHIRAPRISRLGTFQLLVIFLGHSLAEDNVLC